MLQTDELSPLKPVKDITFGWVQKYAGLCTTQSGAEVKHKRYAEPLTTTETLEDWKTSLFKD